MIIYLSQPPFPILLDYLICMYFFLSISNSLFKFLFIISHIHDCGEQRKPWVNVHYSVTHSHERMLKLQRHKNVRAFPESGSWEWQRFPKVWLWMLTNGWPSHKNSTWKCIHALFLAEDDPMILPFQATPINKLPPENR